MATSEQRADFEIAEDEIRRLQFPYATARAVKATRILISKLARLTAKLASRRHWTNAEIEQVIRRTELIRNLASDVLDWVAKSTPPSEMTALDHCAPMLVRVGGTETIAGIISTLSNVLHDSDEEGIRASLLSGNFGLSEINRMMLSLREQLRPFENTLLDVTNRLANLDQAVSFGAMELGFNSAYHALDLGGSQLIRAKDDLRERLVWLNIEASDLNLAIGHRALLGSFWIRTLSDVIDAAGPFVRVGSFSELANYCTVGLHTTFESTNTFPAPNGGETLRWKAELFRVAQDVVDGKLTREALSPFSDWLFSVFMASTAPTDEATIASLIRQTGDIGGTSNQSRSGDKLPVSSSTTKPSELGSIDEESEKILRALVRMRPRLVDLYDLETDTHISRKTVGSRVNGLIERRLAERPNGPRGGVGVTDAGARLVAELDAQSKRSTR